MESIIQHTSEYPWYNKIRLSGKYDLSDNTMKIHRSNFLDILRYGLQGARLSNIEQCELPNMYSIFGCSYEEYKYIDNVLDVVDKWCDKNDERHPENGWILMIHPNTDDLLAHHISKRGIPVIFINSHFNYPNHPSYATAGLFGPGKITYEYDNNVFEVLGGYVKQGEHDYWYVQRNTVSFSDEEMRSMNDYIGGILVVGGDYITREKCEIHRFQRSNRPGDFYIPVLYTNGNVSELDCIYRSR